MAEFGPGSRIREVLEGREDAGEILYRHGYDIGEGFRDVLSQFQTLEHASRAGRLRDLPRLIEELNRR